MTIHNSPDHQSQMWRLRNQCQTPVLIPAQWEPRLHRTNALVNQPLTGRYRVTVDGPNRQVPLSAPRRIPLPFAHVADQCDQWTPVIHAAGPTLNQKVRGATALHVESPLEQGSGVTVADAAAAVPQITARASARLMSSFFTMNPR